MKPDCFRALQPWVENNGGNLFASSSMLTFGIYYGSYLNIYITIRIIYMDIDYIFAQYFIYILYILEIPTVMFTGEWRMMIIS